MARAVGVIVWATIMVAGAALLVGGFRVADGEKLVGGAVLLMMFGPFGIPLLRTRKSALYNLRLAWLIVATGICAFFFAVLLTKPLPWWYRIAAPGVMWLTAVASGLAVLRFAHRFVRDRPPN